MPRAVRQYLTLNVLEAARLRLKYVFDNFEAVYVSFSAGKDSSVLLHLAAEEAAARGRRIGVLLVDLEAQYRLTIQHAHQMFSEYEDVIEPYWVALPLNLRNAVSVYEPQWLCWDPERRADWVREQPVEAITDEGFFPFFRRGMEFEEFVPAFGEWYAAGRLTCCLVGIRSDESLNRWRTLIAPKSKFHNLSWTTWKGSTVYNAYPIYDWKTADIWRYNGKLGKSYNRLYDLMQRAGVPLHNQRICQPYGDDQRRGLWLFHLIEPDTWARVVARVNGANSGALYVRETGNIMGNVKVTKPAGHTWESFAHLLLESMPARTAEHYRNKIAVFLHWYQARGYEQGIPDEADAREEAARNVPSWRRVCKALLRNDYWCKGLSFTQHKSQAYEQYLKVMKNRRRAWGMA